MIEHGVKLPVIRQAQMRGLARSSVYYEPAPVRELDLATAELSRNVRILTLDSVTTAQPP
jgi:hypothetical protein